MLAVIGTLAGVVLGLAGAWLVEFWREKRSRSRERRDRRIAALYALQEHIPPITKNLLIQWEAYCDDPQAGGADEAEVMRAVDEKGHHSMWARIYAARIGDAELNATLKELGDAGADMANQMFLGDPPKTDEERWQTFLGPMTMRLNDAEGAVQDRIEVLLRRSDAEG